VDTMSQGLYRWLGAVLESELTLEHAGGFGPQNNKMKIRGGLL
jgi:hypothetical protein